MKTELERLEKLALEGKVAYKAALTKWLCGTRNTTYAAWFKAELDLSNYLKEQDNE